MPDTEKSRLQRENRRTWSAPNAVLAPRNNNLPFGLVDGPARSGSSQPSKTSPRRRYREAKFQQAQPGLHRRPRSLRSTANANTQRLAQRHEDGLRLHKVERLTLHSGTPRSRPGVSDPTQTGPDSSSSSVFAWRLRGARLLLPHPEAASDLAKWMQQGKLNVIEDIVDGLENTPSPSSESTPARTATS